ncbi:hypothetical protein QR685DRAFT_584004 [Neurospora intermedia]|uniref:Uncharacterized protein n=1 Tax=Neurospora intermedia TaxID=5142 RepID=A0ABR3DLI1_NEUIN
MHWQECRLANRHHTLCQANKVLPSALVGYLSVPPPVFVDMGTPLVPNRAFASSHLFLFSQSEDGWGWQSAGRPSFSFSTYLVYHQLKSALWNLTGAMNEVLPLGAILLKKVSDSLHSSRAGDKPVEVPHSTHPSRTPCCVSAVWCLAAASASR